MLPNATVQKVKVQKLIFQKNNSDELELQTSSDKEKQLDLSGCLSVSENIQIKGTLNIGSGTNDSSVVVKGDKKLQVWQGNEGQLLAIIDASVVDAETDAPSSTMTVKGNFAKQLKGEVTVAGKSQKVESHNTNFSEQMKEGDAIRINSEVRKINKIEGKNTLYFDKGI
jgi:hypothetical protein